MTKLDSRLAVGVYLEVSGFFFLVYIWRKSQCFLRKKFKKGPPKGSIAAGYTYLTVKEKEVYHYDAVQEH